MQDKMDKNILADPNINYSIHESAIMQANNKYMPIKTVKFQKYKHKRNDWITLGILNSIKHRDKLYKKLRITKANTPLYDNLRVNLKTFNTILKRSIRIAKKKHYAQQFNVCKHDSRKTWKNINDILSNHKPKTSPDYFLVEQSKVRDNLEIANNFNLYFTNIGINLAKDIQTNVEKEYASYLKACAQRFRYALFAFIHTQTYFEYYTLTLRLASLVKRAVIYAYWTKELFDICRENVSHMATLPSVARHVIHADNLGPHH